MNININSLSGNNTQREIYSINTYIRSESSWIKKSKFQPQETIRENKPNISRMKEIIKIRAETNESENKKPTQKNQ